MNKLIPIIFSISILLSSCKNSTDSNSPLVFSKMEIHYTKMGGWIHTSILDIYGSGLVNGYILKHASCDTLDCAADTLSQNEMNNLGNLFGSFSNYDSYYEPEQFRTDQNIHTVILIYNNKRDTVSVYEPGRANIPNGLYNIIHEMEQLLERILINYLSLK